MKKIIFAFMMLTFLAACNSSKDTTANDNTQVNRQQNRQQGQRGKKGRPSVDELFAKMDENQDGKLALTEVDGRLKKDFTKIDTNEDGFLSKTEVQNAPKPQRGQRPRRN